MSTTTYSDVFFCYYYHGVLLSKTLCFYHIPEIIKYNQFNHISLTIFKLAPCLLTFILQITNYAVVDI